MELRKGYKNTDIGVIPEDWKVEIVDNISNVKSGKRLPKGNYLLDTKNKYPYIRVKDMFIGGVSLNEIKYVPENIYPAIKNYRIFKDDIFISVAGTLGIVGKIPIQLDGANLTENANKLTNIKSNREFLLYVFTSDLIQNRIEEERTLGAQPKLALTRIRNFQIPLPPTIEEQTAIATVLSDTDSLIQALEKKIAKKQLIKKGAMQKLLSPKDGWKKKLLPKVCWFQEGPGLRNWQFTKKGMKVINVTNLVNGYLNLDKTDRHISMQEFEKMYKHFEIDNMDIVMASSGNSYSKVAVVRKQDLRLLMNTSVIRFKPINGLDYNYLLIFLKSNLFKDQIDLMITGGAQPNFGPFHLNKIVLPLPPTREEQIEIAAILTDIDTEIETLEKKLVKYKELKQGLMQVLLTGKIRLL